VNPNEDYTQAVLAWTRVLIDQHEAEKAHTVALIAELRARLATSWALLDEIERQTRGVRFFVVGSKLAIRQSRELAPWRR
jgi:hypothetical protein